MPNCSCPINSVRDDKKKKKSKHGTWEARNALPKRTLNFRRVMITPRNLFGFNKIKLKKKKKKLILLLQCFTKWKKNLIQLGH